MLQFYQNNFSLFLDKEGKLNCSAVPWMLPILFKVHFVPQPSLQRGGTGAECTLPLLLFWARGDCHKQEIQSCPENRLQCKRLKISIPRRRQKLHLHHWRILRNSILTQSESCGLQNKRTSELKKNPQEVFTPEIQPLVVYLETRPVSVCVGEYDWLFPDKNKITINKEMTVQAYKSPVMNFDMTVKILLGYKNYTHTIYLTYILYTLHIHTHVRI